MDNKDLYLFWQNPKSKMVNLQLKEKINISVALDYLDETEK